MSSSKPRGWSRSKRLSAGKLPERGAGFQLRLRQLWLRICVPPGARHSKAFGQALREMSSGKRGGGVLEFVTLGAVPDDAVVLDVAHLMNRGPPRRSASRVPVNPKQQAL